MSVKLEQYSRSSRSALGFAEAAARNRAQSPQIVIEPADLLVGILLAHPGSEGEARVLLSHFGLTVRDVLPADYPSLTADDLRRSAGAVSADAPAPLSTDIEQAMLSLSTDEVHVRHLLGWLLHVSPSSALHGSLEDRLAVAGISLSLVASVYDEWLGDPAHHQKGSAAARSLRDMLERGLPRRPINVPSYAPDRASGGEDLVGIQREVDAFAYLLASKAQRPPLAVGLFGDWGSGKSFFMRAVQQRIAAIETQVADRKQADVPFWKNVRQIEFNAWEYVRGTLWASLLDHIFEELDDRHIRLVNDRREVLVRARDIASSRARKHTAARERLAGRVKEADEALSEAERDRELRLQQLRTQQSERLAEKLAGAGRDAWADAIASGLAGDNAAELTATLDAARSELVRARGLLGAYWTTRRIVLATLVALIVPGIALAADALGLSPVVALLGGLSATVPAITALLRSATQWTREQLDEIADVARELADAERELDGRVEQAREQFRDAAAKLTEETAAEQDALVEAATLQGELKALSPGRVLGEFLQERSRSDDYRQHLGLLATVREDLRNLEQLVRENNESGDDPADSAPPNRIILYIDDLDRCSPEKVVDVLEAVHLLLAFELFVVVVAVDSRWLSHALTNELHALDTSNRGGRRATPQDYLEKIFQLPFWVQPLSAAGRRSLVHGLLEGSVHASGPDKTNGDQPRSDLNVGPREEDVIITMLSRRGADPRLDAHLLALTPNDLRFMESLAPLLGDTPRRVKRFVNITQLLLALPPSLDQDARMPADREVVALLAAINSGLPNLAPRLFDAVQLRRTTTLLETVTALTSVPAEERERLAGWLQDQASWSTLPLSRLEMRLDVVRRLSFYRQPILVTGPASVT